MLYCMAIFLPFYSTCGLHLQFPFIETEAPVWKTAGNYTKMYCKFLNKATIQIEKGQIIIYD